jgi:hypothetical protein
VASVVAGEHNGSGPDLAFQCAVHQADVSIAQGRVHLSSDRHLAVVPDMTVPASLLVNT